MAKNIFRGVGGLNIGVIGAQELIGSFKSLGEDSVQWLAVPAVAAANVILKKAQSLVPVDTGKLKKSLKVLKPGKGNAKSYKMIARVSFPRGAAYAIPLELGHKVADWGGQGYVEPRPFLRPAADSSKTVVAAIMAEAMDNIIKGARGK
jgi:HK97 gp10 family phage protein